jgi:hypothetical protein
MTAVSGHERIGGVAGMNRGTVQNCYNTGDVVSGSGNGIGGVVGDNGRTVRNCYNTGDVSGLAYVGGVVGLSIYGTVEYCYNTGKVSGLDNVGGVAGQNGSLNTVQNCVALNEYLVRDSGSELTFGRVAGVSSSTLTNNYGRNPMTVAGSPVDSGTLSQLNGANVTDAQARTDDTWWRASPPNGPAWDFTTIWEWGGNLPKLRNMP